MERESSSSSAGGRLGPQYFTSRATDTKESPEWPGPGSRSAFLGHRPGHSPAPHLEAARHRPPRCVRRSVIGGCRLCPAAIGCLGLFVPCPAVGPLPRTGRRKFEGARWVAAAVGPESRQISLPDPHYPRRSRRPGEPGCEILDGRRNLSDTRTWTWRPKWRR